jgi:hypothetical protein
MGLSTKDTSPSKVQPTFIGLHNKQCATIVHYAGYTEEEIQPLSGDAQRDAGIIMIGEKVAGFFGLHLSAPGSMTHH